MSVARAPVRCLLVGAGAWGRNLLRVLSRHPDVELAGVVDVAPASLAAAAPLAPAVPQFVSLEAALAGCDARAAVVSTPAATHFEVAARLIDAGLHALVEKPLATAPEDADALADRARAAGVVGMVGHLLLFHPAVLKMLALVREGAVGKPRYVAAARLSPPTRVSDGSALWALAPHDLSVLHALDSAPLAAARSIELAADGRGVCNAALLHARLASGLAAQLELSRVHAFKVRRLAVVGERAVLIFDDASSTDKLHLAHVPTPRAEAAPSFEAFLHAGGGDARVIPVEMREPLADEVDHFVRAVRGDVAVRTPFSDGATIVHWLARAAHEI